MSLAEGPDSNALLYLMDSTARAKFIYILYPTDNQELIRIFQGFLCALLA